MRTDNIKNNVTLPHLLAGVVAVALSTAVGAFAVMPNEAYASSASQPLALNNPLEQAVNSQQATYGEKSSYLGLNGSASTISEDAKGDEDSDTDTQVSAVRVYRLYNTATSEHLYTSGADEYLKLAEYYGWTKEGKAFDAVDKGIGVYRLYNPALGAIGRSSHHYTTSKEEATNLVSKYGWVYDNVPEGKTVGEPVFYSAQNSGLDVLDGAASVYRLYNDNLSAHLFTLSNEERMTNISKYDWNDEEIGYYAFNNTNTGTTDEKGFTTVCDQSDKHKLFNVTVGGGSGAENGATDADDVEDTNKTTGIAGIEASIDNEGALCLNVNQEFDIETFKVTVTTVTLDSDKSQFVNNMKVTLNDTNKSQTYESKTKSNGVAKFSNIDDLGIYVDTENLVYTGEEIKPEVTVDEMTENVDYKLTYNNNVNAGTGSVTITGLGDVVGSKTISFEIAKANPEYTLPKSSKLVALVGQTLSDVSIYTTNENGSFVWADSSLSVGEAGFHDFAAKFVPNDTANYNTIDLTLTLTVKNVYKVEFDTDGGTPTPEAQDLPDGKKAVEPTDVPVKKGYKFDGWTLNGEAYDFDTVPSENLTLKAKWTAKDKNVNADKTGDGTVAISTNESGEVSTLYADTGDMITVTPTPDDASYVAQVRYASKAEGSAEEYSDFKSVASQDGVYQFEKPEGDVKIYVDFVSIAWDGSLDISWYDPASTEYHIQYPAQFEGLAAIVNGLFTIYPTKEVDSELGDSHSVPDYDAYLKAMGATTTGSASSGNVKITSSNLYGVFTSSYDLVNSQASSLPEVSSITKTARLIGDPSYITCNNSDGALGGNAQSTTSTTYFGSDNMNGKTIYIDSDLDFGATLSGGSWSTSSSIFAGLGGQYAAVPQNEYTTISSTFNGTLDGQGHSLSFVYGEHYSNLSSSPSKCFGIVGVLGVDESDSSSNTASNPTVRNVVLESGWMSANDSSGCIVGKIDKTTTGSAGAVIERCINKADIAGSLTNGIGGICGSAWNQGTIRYCANFGAVKGLNANCVTGGIVGTSAITVQGCYNTGDVKSGNDATSDNSEAIGTQKRGESAAWKDCYYLTGSDCNFSYPGVYGGTQTNVSSFDSTAGVTALKAWMLNGVASSTDDSNPVWFDDTNLINEKGGISYPVLSYQRKDV